MIRFLGDSSVASPLDTTKYLMFDRDKDFREEVFGTITGLGITPKRISFPRPSQNEVAERRGETTVVIG